MKAMDIWRKRNRKIFTRLRLKKNPLVKKALSQLYPLEDQERLYEEYHVKKLAFMIMVLAVGLGLLFFFYLLGGREGRLLGKNRLIRNEWRKGEDRVILEAASGEWKRKIPVTVGERLLDEEECREMFQEISRKLPMQIKGKNQSLLWVKNDLQLLTFLSEYPVRITWESNNQRIGPTGQIVKDGLKKTGEWAELTAVISYEKEQLSVSYQVYLLPESFSEEEQFFRALEEEIKAAESIDRSRKSIFLPLTLWGRTVSFREVTKNRSVWLLLLVVLAAVSVGKGMDRELEKKLKERERQLCLEYPDFVSRLRLYLSAGMTVKNVFFQMMKEGRQRADKEDGYLQKEILIVCNQFQNGVSEEKVYRDFGQRCVEIGYRRLALLLITHLKEGNGQLLKLLAAQEEGAREDRKQQAKKAGEEAGTKMLFPMMLQLLVVMFLILVPAYIDFGGI